METLAFIGASVVFLLFLALLGWIWNAKGWKDPSSGGY